MIEAVRFLYLSDDDSPPAERTEPLPYGTLVHMIGSPVQVIPLTKDSILYVREDGAREGYNFNQRATDMAAAHNRDERIHGPALVVGPMILRGQVTSLSDGERDRLLALSQ